MHQILLGVLLGLALVGCKSNDDFIASKDRELQEREQASEALRKRLADAESVRVVRSTPEGAGRHERRVEKIVRAEARYAGSGRPIRRVLPEREA